MSVGRSARESGQAAVESALVMPIMVLLALGILQLTMLQQARLMTDYAAYQAVRSGIVWNGNSERMHDAALLSLLPTMGATNNVTNLAKTYARAQLTDLAFQALPWSGPPEVNGQPLKGTVRVDTLNPANYPQLGSIWNLRGKGNWEELDFDAADTYSEGLPELSERFSRFSDPNVPASDQELLRRVGVLTVRVRYWYELRIPFANWFVFVSWFAANAGTVLHGALDRPTIGPGNVTNRSGNVDALVALAPGVSHQKGLPTAERRDMQILWALASGATPLPGAPTNWGGGKRFFVPLTATYSMRMQSNFHRKWLVHESPSWAP